jgi:hypothetical protein
LVNHRASCQYILPSNLPIGSGADHKHITPSVLKQVLAQRLAVYQSGQGNVGYLGYRFNSQGTIGSGEY